MAVFLSFFPFALKLEREICQGIGIKEQHIAPIFCAASEVVFGRQSLT
jgi:hypothetical protein